MFKVVVGHSNDVDSDDAIAEVLTQCQDALQGLEPQAGLLLSAIDFEHDLILQKIHDLFPNIELIGGTTDGEISSVLGFEEDSLTLMLFVSDRIEIHAGIGGQASQNIPQATRAAVSQSLAKHQQPVRFCLTLPESLTASAVTILEGLKQALGTSVPIFGGLTADQWRFKQTYQFYGTDIYSDAIPVLTFGGPVQFSHGVASGWHPIGKQGVVTKVEQNVVYEIDGRPALDFYAYYLGDRPPSSEYPLAVFDQSSERYYMRAPSGKTDPETGAVYLFGDVPEGAMVQITETTRDDILQASQQSMTEALQAYPEQQSPDAALFFSCASRRQILGSRTREEYELAHSCLSTEIPSCGFYTNGEISPLQAQGLTHFHNETFITLLIGEA